MVHRDIKPDNILLDSKGNLFIADFGLALTDELFDLTTGLLGTPAYMSPEQASGQAHMVDGRTDIFSLGVIFYEFLAGRRPFEAKTVSLTLQQIIRVAARPPRQINDSIPKELERICLKALNKNLDDRYLTGLDFAEDLKNYLRQVDVGASTKVAGDSVFSNFPSSSSTSSSTTGSGLNKSRNVDAPGMESVSKVLESGGATLQSALANSDKEFSRTRPLLEQQLYDIKDGDAAKTKVLLALLPADPSYAKLLVDPLLAANPQDFMVIRQRLAPYAEVVIPLLEQKFARLPELDNSLWTGCRQPGNATKLRECDCVGVRKR
ncbi:serine/threonine protein kinase [bacterium]|nr:serine/threonine protein kinase [bacterium]